MAFPSSLYSNAIDAGMVQSYTLHSSFRLRRLGLLCSVLGPRGDPATNTTLQLVSIVFPVDIDRCVSYQIQRSSDQMVLDTRAILRAATSYHDN
jgi:hypothetical protein